MLGAKIEGSHLDVAKSLGSPPLFFFLKLTLRNEWSELLDAVERKHYSNYLDLELGVLRCDLSWLINPWLTYAVFRKTSVVVKA